MNWITPTGGGIDRNSAFGDFHCANQSLHDGDELRTRSLHMRKENLTQLLRGRPKGTSRRPRRDRVRKSKPVTKKPSIIKAEPSLPQKGTPSSILVGATYLCPGESAGSPRQKGKLQLVRGHGYANPDVEILNAVEPGLATTGGPLILASSPHARRGALWDVFKRHYGAGGDPLILVAHGATRTLNPSLPQRVVDRALEKDRARATAEYLAQFRTDVEGFVALEIVEAALGDYREMLPAAERAITELSLIRAGGSDDSFALAISHKSKDRIIIDAVRETRPPF